MSTSEPFCGTPVGNPFGERFLYEINRNTFSQTDAATLYQQRFAHGLTTPDTLYLIVGTDSGLLPQYILNQNPGVNSHYLFIEPEQVQLCIENNKLLSQLPQNMEIVSADKLPQRIEDDCFVSYFIADKVKLYESFAARDAFLPQYRHLCSQAESVLKNKALQLRIDINNRTFYEKQLENIAENRTPAMALRHLFQGKTAVILGGGPSLDIFLPWVLDNKDKLVVFAVSRIARRLIEVDLIPHLVFSVDQQDVSFSISREMLLFSEDVLFIHSNHVANRLCAYWKGRNLYLGPRFPWHTEAEPENIDPWGPTVTNTALGAAVAMGFARAILIGVDFCYNSTGMTHAAGSNESDAGPKLDDTVTVETNDGNTAETSPGYYHAMGYLAEQAERARQEGCQVISPAPGAARIAAVDYLPTNKISLAPFADAPGTLIFSALPPDTPESRAADGKKVLAELARARTALRKVAFLATEALECCRQLYQRTDGKPDPHMLQRIHKIEARFDGELADFSSVAKSYNMPELLKATSAALDQHQRYLGYFRAWRQGAQKFCTLVEKATQRMLIRLEEDAPQPEIKKIFDLWREDRQLLRILVLKQRRPDLIAALPANWKKYTDIWEENARKWIRERLDGTRKTPVPPRNLSRVRGKAFNLFLQRDRAELERLFNGLTQHPDSEQAAQLQVLIKGYHCELSENRDQALECYQMLIGEELNPLTEEALRRISVVALEQNNLELAQLALECLSNASVTYQPRYADLLAAVGQHQQAADLYTSYLEVVPGDIAVLIRLGKNYRAMGAEKAAQATFALVLEQDPGNASARTLLNEPPPQHSA